MNNTAGEILCKAEMKPKTKDIEANYKLVKQIPRISNVWRLQYSKNRINKSC